MWNADDQLQDTKYVIPDSSYADLYRITVEHCKEHGAFDPTTMGTTPNVGLMAQKAEEYGSHDKTFEIAAAGPRRGRRRGRHRPAHAGGRGRATSSAPARPRTRRSRTGCSSPSAAPAPPAPRPSSGSTRPAPTTPRCSTKVRAYLAERGHRRADDRGHGRRRGHPLHARAGPAPARTPSRVTGNVLRDYLTDLFPILELGTSAKMLSIVPLMNGGGLFETGAGGSAPKHVQQLVKEDYLRWDSLGEFLALAVSFEFLGEKTGNARAALLGRTLDEATGRVLEEGRSPARKVGQIDNRGSHFYLALYWAQALARQTDDAEAAALFAAAGRAARRATSRRSSTSCSRCRASRPTSAATTTSTRPRPTPSCGRARRSTQALADF